jgi:hypothetical protein
MHPTLAAHAAVDVDGLSPCMWSSRDDHDSSVPLANFREGRTSRGVRLNTERHLAMKGDDCPYLATLRFSGCRRGCRIWPGRG